jgi:hypothetical protein
VFAGDTDAILSGLMEQSANARAAHDAYERAGKLAWTCAVLLNEGKVDEAREHAARAVETQGAALYWLGVTA